MARKTAIVQASDDMVEALRQFGWTKPLGLSPLSEVAPDITARGIAQVVKTLEEHWFKLATARFEGPNDEQFRDGTLAWMNARMQALGNGDYLGEATSFKAPPIAMGENFAGLKTRKQRSSYLESAASSIRDWKHTLRDQANAGKGPMTSVARDHLAVRLRSMADKHFFATIVLDNNEPDLVEKATKVDEELQDAARYFATEYSSSRTFPDRERLKRALAAQLGIGEMSDAELQQHYGRSKSHLSSIEVGMTKCIHDLMENDAAMREAFHSEFQDRTPEFDDWTWVMTKLKENPDNVIEKSKLKEHLGDRRNQLLDILEDAGVIPRNAALRRVLIEAVEDNPNSHFVGPTRKGEAGTFRFSPGNEDFLLKTSVDPLIVHELILHALDVYGAMTGQIRGFATPVLFQTAFIHMTGEAKAMEGERAAMEVLGKNNPMARLSGLISLRYRAARAVGESGVALEHQPADGLQEYLERYAGEYPITPALAKSDAQVRILGWTGQSSTYDMGLHELSATMDGILDARPELTHADVVGDMAPFGHMPTRMLGPTMATAYYEQDKPLAAPRPQFEQVL